MCFLSFPYQSPDKTDKEEVDISEAEEKLDPAVKSTDVYTEKHSDNLFKRTEVLAGELPAVSSGKELRGLPETGGIQWPNESTLHITGLLGAISRLFISE